MTTLRDKSNVIKAKLDRFTIARSKEMEISTENNSTVEEEKNMLQSWLEGDIGRDKTFYKKLAAEVAK